MPDMNGIWSVRALFVFATISVIALLAASDFDAPCATSIAQIPPGSEEVRLICVLESAKPSANGWTLLLKDGQGQEVGAYVASGKIDVLPDAGEIVEVVADLSWDEGLFLYVREIETVRV